MTALLPHRLTFEALPSAGRLSAVAEQSEPLSVHLLDPFALSEIDQRNWDQLGCLRSGDNMFAEPWLMRLSISHFDGQRQVRLALVTNAQGEWIGVMPLVRKWRLGRLIWPHWALWGHPNQFNNSPLVRAGAEADFWRAVFEWLDRQPGLPVALGLDQLPCDDPAARALVQVCQSAGRSWRVYRHYSRAALRNDAGVRQRLEAACRSKNRRRLESLERQLIAEHGPVALRTTRDPREIARMVDDFLELESAGWKGAAGSALGHACETRDFFKAVASAAASRGRFEFSWLEAGGRAIDMTTQFIGGEWSSGFKRAHDERFSRFAPGQLHLKHLTRRLVEEGQGNFDSCASPGQESINRLWPDRRELFDCTIAIGGPLRKAVCRSLSLVNQAWHRAKQAAGRPEQGDRAK